jgi:CO/xanthine dehydrogenase Mo-binding subunit
VHPEREEAQNNVAYHLEFVRGEGEAAFEHADLTIEDRFSTQAQHQCYLELQACVAQWDVSGRLTVWGTAQCPFSYRSELGRALGIPEDRIRIIRPYVGGGFGGRVMMHQHFPICALLARKAMTPVKIEYTREEEFIFGRPRISEIIDLRLGFKKDGTMVAKSVVVTADGGAYAGLAPSIVGVSLTRPDCLYRMPNIKAVGNLVYTNKIPRSPFRGFGNTEMLYAMESLIDMAAERLGMDPVEIRLKNCVHKGDVTAHGWILNSCGLAESIQITAGESQWKAKKQKAGSEKNRGIGMACQVHVSSKRVHPLYDGSAAIVNIDQYGKAKVISGETDIGQGMTTIFAQIAAEELGIGIENVEVLPTVDTDISPYCFGTYASRVSTMGGNAVRLAARDGRDRLLRGAAELLKLDADILEIRNGDFYSGETGEKIASVREVARDIVLGKQGGVPITGRGEYTVPGYVVRPDATGYGNYSVGYAFSTQIAEVSVDTETGKVDVINVWVGQDVGRALNPKLCEGQIDGGVVQGMGYALSENYIWGEGKVLNPRFTDYKIPTFSGTPGIHYFWVETNEPGGPFGGKSIGEAAMNPTAVAIANAVYDAVGVRIKDLPLTPEKITRALREKQKTPPEKARRD